MPGYDRTGPMGMGAGTGRGMGPCGGSARGASGRRSFLGLGRGGDTRGCGRGFGGGGGRGFGGRQGMGGAFSGNFFQGSATQTDEIEFLKNSASDLKSELEAIQQRLKELEGE